MAVATPPQRPADQASAPVGPPPPGARPSADGAPSRRTSMTAVAAAVAVILATAAFSIVLGLTFGSSVASHPASGGSNAVTQVLAGSNFNPLDLSIDPTTTPDPTWKPFDPSLAPATDATVHNVAFHIRHVVRDVAPGISQTVWTFNGQSPGPTLRGHIGDVFNVSLINDSPMSHSIDFHASRTAMDKNMRELAPGQSLVYQFKAQFSGVFMYHCGTSPALEHIGNGMFGAVVIDPPNLAPVDHEYLMIQSELYLGPKGLPGDFAKMKAAAPDGVVFNGYYSQYKFAPISVPLHSHIRIWVLNVGPSDISSFHIVGTIFTTVYKEGAYTLPAGSPGGSQALDLTPAQGGFIETTLDDPGHYTMITHRFVDVGKGAAGTILVGGPTSGG